MITLLKYNEDICLSNLGFKTRLLYKDRILISDMFNIKIINDVIYYDTMENLISKKRGREVNLFYLNEFFNNTHGRVNEELTELVNSYLNTDKKNNQSIKVIEDDNGKYGLYYDGICSDEYNKIDAIYLDYDGKISMETSIIIKKTLECQLTPVEVEYA